MLANIKSFLFFPYKVKCRISSIMDSEGVQYPDYTNPTDFSTTFAAQTAYTAPADGWIFMYPTAIDNNPFTIYINGQSYPAPNQNASYLRCPLPVVFVVEAGTTIQVTSNSSDFSRSYAWFLPYVS